MDPIDTSKLVKMGTKPIGGAQVTFYTNALKDSLFLEGVLSDVTQIPNLAVLKKVTQALKGTLDEEAAKSFLKLLITTKKSPCTKVLSGKMPKNGNGRSFVQEAASEFVKMGEIVGRITPPQQGEHGINLYGQPIPATTSNEINFTFDDSVFIKEDKIIANRDGKLIYDDIHHTLTVSAPYSFEISEDKMEGYLTYIDRIPLTIDFIRKVLAENNIVFGILEDQIAEAVRQHAATRKPLKKFLLAKGNPMIETKQGRIVFSFDHETKKVFDENSDAKVDYKSVNKIQSVKKDERIALIRKPVPGRAGINILGITVNPSEPREAALRPMNNVRASENMMEFFAEKDGSPVFKHGMLSVVDIMQIKGNLSLATGNIDFEGSVSIEGDVGDEYTIKAEGDIIIGGSVGSSKLIAGGRIEIGQGFNGRGVGQADCIGDFHVKFMKEVTVNCEGHVTVETEALNCNINALGQLLMEKANLMGGESNVLAGVFVNDIGSSLGIKTRINPGINYLYATRKSSLEKKLEEIKQKTIDINAIIGPILKDKSKLASLPNDKRQRIMEMVSTLKGLKTDSEYTQQELIKLVEDNKSNRINEVVAYNRVYPGSIFKIGYSQKEFKTELTGPVLITEDLENRTIRTGPIKMRNKPVAINKSTEN